MPQTWPVTKAPFRVSPDSLVSGQPILTPGIWPSPGRGVGAGSRGGSFPGAGGPEPQLLDGAGAESSPFHFLAHTALVPADQGFSSGFHFPEPDRKGCAKDGRGGTKELRAVGILLIWVLGPCIPIQWV